MNLLTGHQRAEIRQIVKDALRQDRGELIPFMREIIREEAIQIVVRSAGPRCATCGSQGIHGEHGTGKPIFCDCLHGKMAEIIKTNVPVIPEGKGPVHQFDQYPFPDDYDAEGRK